MRERLRIFIAACFYYSGLVRLALWWKRRSRRYLTILNYHRAVGENLERQMRFLQRHYRIMHLEDALDELYAVHPADHGTKNVHKQKAPLALTFDDGYLDNYTCAFELAKKLCLPITIFLIPGYIESGAYFWWLADDYLVKHATVDDVTLEGKVYRLGQRADRQMLAGMIDRRTRQVASVAEREAFLVDIQQLLAVSLPDRQHQRLSDTALPLNWREVREMAQSGWVSFGAHTMHHPVIACLADPEELRKEVVECRLILEQQLEKPLRTFCYPIGKLEHIGEQGMQAVKAAGYRWALTTIEDVNTQETDPYLLRRLPGDVDVHWLVMASELAGLLGNMSRIRKAYERFIKER